MKVFDWQELKRIGGVVAIGSFDGVHLGHRKLLQYGKKLGKLNVMTFSPHPRIVLQNIKEDFLLNTDEEKYNLLRNSGADNVFFIHFTEELADFPPEFYIEKVICSKIKPDRIIVGFDHNFGKGGVGRANFLKDYCKKFNLDVIIFPEVKKNNKEIKSSLIRGLLRKGKVLDAKEFLGRFYSFGGVIIQGEGLGNRIGFPTSNVAIDTALKVLPCDGVYAARVKVAGFKYNAMLYVGRRPTLKKQKRVVEVHILNFEKNIYGEHIDVEVIRRIRDEKSFDSIGSLRDQLYLDKKEIEKTFKEVKNGS